MNFEKNKVYFEEVYQIMKAIQDDEPNVNRELAETENLILDKLAQGYFQIFKENIKKDPSFIKKVNEKFECVDVNLYFLISTKQIKGIDEILEKICTRFNNEIMPNCGDVIYCRKNHNGTNKIEPMANYANSIINLFRKNKKEVYVLDVRFKYDFICVKHMYSLGEIIHEKHKLTDLSKDANKNQSNNKKVVL